MTNRFVSPNQQFINSFGQPYAGGQLFFYLSGTSTPTPTYQDEALTTPNTNPVILDAAGDAGNIFLNSAIIYKVVLEDVNGNLVWTYDPVIPLDNLGNTINSIIPCSASGTNAVTLTPLVSAQQPTSYSNYQVFSFVPSITSTGAITIQVGGLAAFNLYLAPGVAAGAGALVQGQGPYFIAYGSVVAGSSPGFLMLNLNLNTDASAVVVASGDTSGTTDTASLQAAINSLSSGVITFSGKQFYINGGSIIVSGKTGLHLQGNGRFATILKNIGSNGNTVTFTGACQDCSIEGMTILGDNQVPPTTGYAISFTGNCFECEARQIVIEYMYNGILNQSCTETKLDTIRMRPLAGNLGVYYVGSVSVNCYRMIIDDLVTDNPYPGTSTVNPANITNWASSTHFNANAIVAVNGGIFICTTPGTSGGSGPSGTNFVTPVVDGSAQWLFVCNSTLTWIYMDSYAFSLVIDKAALIDGAYGITMEDNVGGGFNVSAPQWIEGFDIELDHNYICGLNAAHGASMDLVDVWISSVFTSNGITIGSGFAGEFTMSNARIFGNWQHGALVSSPNVYGGFVNCRFSANGVEAPGTVYNGLSFAAGVSNFTVTGCFSGSMHNVGDNYQAYGIEVNTGGSDHYTITNNVCTGNNSGGVGDGGTGMNKTVSGNVT